MKTVETPVLIVGGGGARPLRRLARLGAAPDPAATLGRALAQVLGR
jgi:hypothetical protein